MNNIVAAFDAAIAAWNRGDLARYLDLYDESIRLYGYSPQPMDKSGVTAFYSQVVDALGPDAGAAPRLQVAERFVTGERLVCRFTMSGTHRGNFLGVPATGRPYAIDGITLLRFRADRCVERWSQADMLGLMVQIGAVPPPA